MEFFGIHGAGLGSHLARCMVCAHVTLMSVHSRRICLNCLGETSQIHCKVQHMGMEAYKRREIVTSWLVVSRFFPGGVLTVFGRHQAVLLGGSPLMNHIPVVCSQRSKV